MNEIRLSLFAQGVDVSSHLNMQSFEGCLTLIDTESDKAPSGARGHRVVLTRAAAETALPSLLGMAVDYKAGWDGHDARQKCGIITGAWIEDDRVMISGYFFKYDFPEVATRIIKGDLGMSYELADAHVSDMRAQIWSLKQVTFTGAAIILREKSAVKGTWIKMT